MSTQENAAASGSLALPIVDLTAPNADRDYIQKKHEYGFVAAVKHGIDAGLVQAAFGAMRKVGNLPPETLMRYHHRLSEQTKFRAGYFGYGEEKAKEFNGGWDLKHMWQVFRLGHAIPTPFPAEVPEFEPTMRALFAALDVLQYRSAAAFTRYSGVKLPVPMEQAIVGGDTMMRCLHYPNVAQLHRLAQHMHAVGIMATLPTEAEIRGIANAAMRATPHEDINFTTMLWSVDGLELLMDDGRWMAVEAPPDAIIMQTGDMEQMASGGLFPSMTHRVVNTDDPDSERINIPDFGHPRGEVPLMTKETFKAHCSDGLGIIPSVMTQLEKMGLERRFADPSCEVLCSAGEYLTLRLKEIGIIKDE